jgi:hypothetical protein
MAHTDYNGSELESQTDQSPWASNTQGPLQSELPIPRCMSMDNGLSLTATSQTNNMSIGSLVAPGIHPDLASSLMWSGVDLPLQPRPTFQNQHPETVDDSPFYSSPAETCPSPLSDTTFSLPHSSSSISSTVSIIDQYPKSILKGDVTPSPLQVHTPLLRWDTDATMTQSHLVSMSMGENLIQPVSFSCDYTANDYILTSCQPVQCHYPSPSWSSSDCLSYEDQVQTMHHFAPVSWGM